MPSPQHRRVSDPSLTRKGGLFSHPASWAYLILTVLFCAYVFGYISGDLPDRFFKAISDQQGNVMKLYALAVPAGLVVLALITVIFFSKVSGSVADSVHRKRVTKGRDHVSVQQFAAACSAYEISPKVAAQLYQVLRKQYKGEMKIDLEDNLLHDLRLGESAVHDIVGNVLVACNRIKDVRRPYEIATVLDLALYVDGSPPKSVAQVVNPDPREAARAHAEAAPARQAQREQPFRIAEAPRKAPTPIQAAAPTPIQSKRSAEEHAEKLPTPKAPRHSTSFLAPFRLPEDARAKVPRHVSVVMPTISAIMKRKRTPKGSPFTGAKNDDSEG